MPSRLQMSALTLLISGIWVVLLILDGTLVQITWLRHISTVSGMAVLALASFDLWIWRLPLLRGWFVQRPNIRGTWKVRIESHWIDPRTGTRIGAIEGYARIRQTYSTLRLRLMTRESSSDLLGSEMIREADGGFRVTGVYRNESRLGVRERSPIHYGGLLIDIPESVPPTLRGEYWTDRGTQGELVLSERRREMFATYDAAVSGGKRAERTG